MSGEYLKFEAGESKILRFMGEPTERSFTPKGSDKSRPSFEFPVMLYSHAGDEELRHLKRGVIDLKTLKKEPKTLSVTSQRLMNLLISEDDEEPIINRAFIITAIGTGTERQWKVFPVIEAEQGKVTDAWKPKEDTSDEIEKPDTEVVYNTSKSRQEFTEKIKKDKKRRGAVKGNITQENYEDCYEEEEDDGKGKVEFPT